MESSFKTECKQGIFSFRRDVKDEGLFLTSRKTCPKSRCAGGEVVVEPSFEDDMLTCGEFWIVYCLDFLSRKFLDSSSIDLRLARSQKTLELVQNPWNWLSDSFHTLRLKTGYHIYMHLSHVCLGTVENSEFYILFLPATCDRRQLKKPLLINTKARNFLVNKDVTWPHLKK